MSSYEKEIVLLKTTALSKETTMPVFTKYKEYVKKDYKKIDNKIYYNNKKVKDNSIKIKDIDNDYITLKADNIKNKEIYIRIEGIKYQSLSENEKYNLNLKKIDQLSIDKYNISNKWVYHDSSFKIYVKGNGRSVGESFRDSSSSAYYYENDIMFVNLGYYDNWKGEVKIFFSKPGEYSFNKIEVVAVNYDNYKKDIDDLRRSNFELKEYSNGYMKASINPTSNGIIQFNTNYSKGWKVYVDNKEVDTFKSNKYFLGIKITKGYHDIELKYETPYFKEGINISKRTITIFGLLMCLDMLIKFGYFKLKIRK